MSKRCHSRRATASTLHRFLRVFLASLLATSGLVALGALLAAPAGAASCATGFTQSGATCQTAFPGGIQSITVPAGVSALTMSVAGAAGGDSSLGGQPGAGGTETGNVPVTSGDTVTVLIGEAGGLYNQEPEIALGGFGGGGSR